MTGIYLLIIAASYGVYQLESEPKFCNCSISQNMEVVGVARVSIQELTPKRCVANLNLQVYINRENQLNHADTITLISSRRGKINEQIVIGAPRVMIKERLLVKRNEKLWIEVRSKGKYSLSIVALR